MRPGIYDNISNNDYHSGPGISSSAIKKVGKSPLHYRHEYIDGNRKAPSAAMKLGTLVHALVLEPESFESEFLVVDASSRNTKMYKEIAADPGAKDITLVLTAEHEEAQRIAEAVLSNSTVSNLLAKAVCENSIYWNEEDRLCKCRPDIWRKDIGIVADLKTTSDASPYKFQRSIIDLGYHMSAAWYMRGIEIATGERPDSWAWVVVETSGPYAVQVYEADAEMIAKGWEKCQQALDTLSDCEAFDTWPAYNEGISQITLPSWAA